MRADIGGAEIFLNCIDPFAVSWTFQTFDDNEKRKDASLAKILHGSIHDRFDELCELNSRGAGIFFMPSLGDELGRETKNVRAIRAVYVDLDGAPLEPILACSLPPHAIVATSPGKWHAYWLVSDCPLDRFKPTQKALIRRFDSDKSVNDLPRVMRLPGFIHQKDPTAPFDVTIVETREAPSYSLSEIVLRLGLDLDAESERQPIAGVDDDTTITAGARHGALISYAGRLRALGTRRDEIVDALRAVNARRCKPPKEDAEIVKIAEFVSTKEAGESVLTASSVVDRATAAENASPPKWEDPAPWPRLDDLALHGILGEIVRALAPHTEADPAAMLFSLLTMAGAMIGSGPHLRVGSVKHEARIFIVVCGSTSSGRKGQSLSDVAQIAASADPSLAEAIRVSGLSTGEGLIARLRDREDAEYVEKRAFIHEAEFARLLAVASREGSTLSAILRDAWDGSTLRVLTRKDPLEARGAFVCLVGHITEEELHKHLTTVELANGFANRMLFISAKRSRLLPSGGSLAFETVVALGRAFASALDRARSRGELRRSAAFVEAWEELYGTFSDEPGLAGALLARAAPHTLRLALVYALLDGAEELEVEHLAAGYAAWRYAEDSARYIFGRNLGDDVRQRLLDEIRAVYPDGLDRKAQRDLFNRHVPEAKIGVARTWLIDRGLAAETSLATEGRPRQTLFALAITDEAPRNVNDPLLPLKTRLAKIERESPLPKRPLLPLKTHDHPTPETLPDDLSLNESGAFRGNKSPEPRCSHFNSHPVDPKLPCRDCGQGWLAHQSAGVA